MFPVGLVRLPALALLGGSALLGGCDASATLPGTSYSMGGAFDVPDDGASSGSGGSGGAPEPIGGQGGLASYLAKTCEVDEDCGVGVCIAATDTSPYLEGGPARGYCSLACELDADCWDRSENLAGGLAPAYCMKGSGEETGMCFLGCSFGADDLATYSDPIPVSKCQGREDLRCQSFNELDHAICQPTCGTNAECPEGRLCDQRRAVCVDLSDVEPGDALGWPCDINESTCEGVCVGFTSGNAVCSRPCVLGGSSEYDCGGLEQGLCAFHPDENGTGDFGFCTTTCEDNSQCVSPELFCLGNSSLGPDRGFCLPAKSCPNGDECSAPFVCIVTDYGPYCLDPDHLEHATGSN